MEDLDAAALTDGNLIKVNEYLQVSTRGVIPVPGKEIPLHQDQPTEHRPITFFSPSLPSNARSNPPPSHPTTSLLSVTAPTHQVGEL